MVEKVRFFESRKFMWDNVEYPDMAAARVAAETYERDGFETRVVEEGDSALVYSRRVVSEIVVEGEQPI